MWEPEALTQAERLAKDDPEGVRQVFTAVDRLAGNPRPDGAFGSADLLRIHSGRYRVLYEIHDRQVRVNVIHLGRVR
ncbi:type II toxin-antitoxin system RelE/ParE family toxin [Streptomyces sp. NPDC051987]|uniref:type II toxin-antitoxin system RelE family toxin n=1 Tax=Streptomyces sp. NPDC051987 TaxID=3155808 RepID=UPI00342EEEBA